MINWEEAPIDATHGVFYGGRFRGWRKVDLENNKVYDWHLKIPEGNEGDWVQRHLAGTAEGYLEINKDLIEERPAPVEAELPDGKVWPEGADFYYPPADVFFRTEEPAYRFARKDFWSVGTNALIEDYAKRKGTIHRFPGAQPKAAPKKEEPPKKRAVGWWS